MTAATLAVAVVIAFGGGAPANSQAVAATRCVPPHRWKGVDASNYRISCQVCSAFTLKNLAGQLHVKPDPIRVATALARGYRAGYRQAVFEGCLYGILHR